MLLEVSDPFLLMTPGAEDETAKKVSDKSQTVPSAKRDVKTSSLLSGYFDSKTLPRLKDPPSEEKPSSADDFFSIAAWRSYLLNSNNYFLAIMGGCLSARGDVYIPNNAGNEEAYYNRFLEDKKILGEGEFGVVKLVHDMTSDGGQGEPLACKTLNKGIVFKDNVLYSPLKPHVLKTECEILQTLAGKHFCLDLIAIYESPKHIFVVTELCAGGEMMEYVSKQESLTTNDFSRIAFQLLSAINHCASENILHRDVKPENIMFRSSDPGAQLRLIDFGSGAIDRVQGADDLPVHTTHAGTGFYISPEVFQKSYTSATDVWSCGVTLYVLVAGYPATQLQHAFNILQKPNRDLRTLPGMPENIPDSFINLLDQLLCYRYKQRPSAGKLLNHEFVKFYQRKLKAGIAIDESANNAASPSKPLKNTRFTAAIKKHSVFVQYQQFERSVTTLLATMLFKKDFETLIERLDTEISKGVSKAKDSMNAKSKLNVITINHLKTVLLGMKQQDW